MTHLIHDFIFEAALRAPHSVALGGMGSSLNYGALATAVNQAAAAWVGLGLGRGERLAVYLDKRAEAVVAMFGAAAAGAVFVPVNPLLRPEQVAYILADCGVRILVTSAERLDQLAPALARCPRLHTVVLAGADASTSTSTVAGAATGYATLGWRDCLQLAGAHLPHRCIDGDVAAILYTSGSTGMPKGVVLSHRNMVAGALSVAEYLGNGPDDRLLAVLPLSFDYGLSQLTTAFASGASAVLFNYLLPRDIPAVVQSEGITGLAAVPPLWIQLAQLAWEPRSSLRYITNSGGAMPASVLAALQQQLPQARIFLMYGLTEAFRSTYLPPEQLAQRPGSIGKAIPNAEVLVLRPDGSACAPDEAGELVHRGALVSLGYWNDAARTAERFRPLPQEGAGLALPELAVWSGDTVRADADGYLYFVGRSDDMIKTSGYRVSPTEVEEIAYGTGLVAEAAAIGVGHPQLGQCIVLLVTAAPGSRLEAEQVMAACRARLPAYMVPQWVEVRQQPLPRNPNGKIDRPLLAGELAHLYAEVP